MHIAQLGKLWKARGQNEMRAFMHKWELIKLNVHVYVCALEEEGKNAVQQLGNPFFKKLPLAGVLTAICIFPT